MQRKSKREWTFVLLSLRENPPIDIIVEIEGITMDADALVDEIDLIAYVFCGPTLFMKAITQIKNALLQIVNSKSYF